MTARPTAAQVAAAAGVRLDLAEVLVAEANRLRPSAPPAEYSGTLAARLRQLADELADPMVCRQPAYGAPGWDHCAACCGGTGLVITCQEDQDVADTVAAMRGIARLLEPRKGGRSLVSPAG